MDGWDVAILAIAAFVAVSTLVRLMIRRRNELADHLLREIQAGKASRPAPAATPSRGGRNNAA